VHPEAYEWASRYGTDDPVRLLDLGGRNVNGTIRPLFPNAEITCLDILPGQGVDIVADAGTWTPTSEWDVVTATELFEHAPNWPDICAVVFKALAPGGLFVATMAGPGRPIHSGIDGVMGRILDGEHYGNVHPHDLLAVLTDAGFVDITVDYQMDPCDTRCSARKP
jgi:trans-aconitate methyltransferase